MTGIGKVMTHRRGMMHSQEITLIRMPPHLEAVHRLICNQAVADHEADMTVEASPVEEDIIRKRIQRTAEKAEADRPEHRQTCKIARSMRNVNEIQDQGRHHLRRPSAVGLGQRIDPPVRKVSRVKDQDSPAIRLRRTSQMSETPGGTEEQDIKTANGLLDLQAIHHLTTGHILSLEPEPEHHKAGVVDITMNIIHLDKDHPVNRVLQCGNTGEQTTGVHGGLTPWVEPTVILRTPEKFSQDRGGIRIRIRIRRKG